MGTQLLETLDIDQAVEAETSAPPGLIEVRFYTTEALSREDAQNIFDHLLANGVDVKKVYIKSKPGLPFLGVIYNKPAPEANIAFALPLAVIPLIAFGMIAALIGIGVWKIEDITNNMVKILLVVFGGTILLAAIARKPLEAAATRYIERRV